MQEYVFLFFYGYVGQCFLYNAKKKEGRNDPWPCNFFWIIICIKKDIVVKRTENLTQANENEHGPKPETGKWKPQPQDPYLSH
jgi:hypothetical protein